MRLTDEQLKVLLMGSNLLTSEQFEDAQKTSREKDIPLQEYLPSSGVISDEHLLQIIANHFNYDYVDLKKMQVNGDVLRLVPELVARTRGVVAFAQSEDGVVSIGMLDPGDKKTEHFIGKRVGQPVKTFLISRRDFERALSYYRGSIKDAFNDAMKELEDESLSREERDDTAIRVVDMLVQYAYDNKASDVHIEPYKEAIVVRFRIDGVLHDVLQVPKELRDVILTRIKILSKIRTDEHQAAQDGKFQFETKHERVDMRVSIVPVTGGEKIVMRLLSAKSRKFDLVSLGLSGSGFEKIERAVEKPHGMILVTGPTGSGKTTTVYAVMKILNKREVNISTIEDPVEYDIEGISQIQVNTKTGLTFSNGLKSIVRQDPDIIMVGEIRDEETAGIAVNSAMTGHLVLSTLHTNDAATTLPRLLDMKIEPFLVASTVNVAIAQRLVRKICEKCRVSYKLTEENKKFAMNDEDIKHILKKKKIKDLETVRLYRGAGCNVCGGTGYSGRVGIFEVLEMTEEIKELTIQRASSDEIMEKAREEGMVTMLEDGVEKVFQGITTLEEVFRVSKM